MAEKFRLRSDSDGNIAWDQAGLLNAMNRYWGDAFGAVLGRAERAIVNELLDVRNRFSHNENFSYDDAERALDSMRRLTEAIGAGDPAGRLGRMRETILRTKFEELRRNEERRGTRGQQISVEAAGGLRPWREVVEPHEDVATGRVPASGIRRRPGQGSCRQRPFRIHELARILQPNLSDGRPLHASG